MIIKYTFDIKTQQPVYAICSPDGTAKYLTTSITRAINFLQIK
jgi:hypothetical protein